MVSYSSGSVLAMLQEDDGTYIDDKTLQYIFLLVFKIALNTLILSLWQQNITKSLLGICSLFLYLADLLLISSIFWAWWFKQNLGAQEAICCSLCHSSTVYSLLPIPVLLGAVVDYGASQQEDVVLKSLARTSIHFLVMLVMWAMACVYSYHYTNCELLTIKYPEGLDALVCPVHGSTVISHFNSKLLVVVVFILMLNFRNLPYWFQLVKNPPWYLSTWSRTDKSDQAFSQKQDKPYMIDQQDHPPLFTSLTICFAVSWIPYMVVSVICDILAFAVPSYASVNLIWTACANSLLAGMTFWYNSKMYGPFYKVPDMFCSWSFYWHLSKESHKLPSFKLHDGPSVLEL
ncbi:probable G-protein coupled receptor 160 [Trichomycterus rosablanca]|uniref:probable G-protein coupled receptor 160 n=1 Tax=Trichomycterus rosablanca TaxID=2290929 RepID=UPI002F355834